MSQDSESSPKTAVDRKAAGHHPLSSATVLMMALTVGVTVANNYYAQPLLADIAHTFGLTVTRAGVIAMLSQIGTAIGMFLFVPLGDKFERRSLIVTLLLGAAVSLVFVALARNELWIATACFAVGATASTVHVVVPFAAHLASPEQRGRVVGTVLSGLLFGILLARTFSGWLGAYLGWRSVFWVAAVLMVLLAGVVRCFLPADRPEFNISWVDLMHSTLGLVKKHVSLRESAFLGALAFCSFSAFWTTLVFFLQSPAYRYGSFAAGLFGLVGAVGAAGAPTFGHLAGKHGARTTVMVAIWITLVSFAIMGVAGAHLLGLIAGVIAMDLGVQLSHVSNQTRIYEIDPSARSRLNMVYMVCYFTGGAIGSYLGAVAWRSAGWWGVCVFGMLTQVIALFVHAYFGRKSAA